MSPIAKLEILADLVVVDAEEDGYTYWDASYNFQEIEDYLNKEMGFLSGRDREELMEIWQQAVDDPSCIKMLFNAIKVLQEKYGESSITTNRIATY